MRENPNIDAIIHLEIENLGKEPTSLVPAISFVAHNPGGSKVKGTFEITDQQRRIECHNPQRFSASAHIGADFLFCLYQRYEIKLTRGFNYKLYYRSSLNKRLSKPRYYCELTVYKLFGWYPNENPPL